MRTDAVVGKNIQIARKKQKLTQDQVAARLQVQGCDMSRGVYAKIEVGIRHIALDELKAIKEVLKVPSYDDLFRGE
ncbi:MAG: helix-turn-helix domain-containing protein [Firmicutes bacterium]|nr:helix-turn-helix domain-containing protein [Bacillota bacterium]